MQSLSYGLDFEDKLSITDHRGSEQGSLSIVLTPCEKNGKPLGDDHFVEDPSELLNKGKEIYLRQKICPFHVISLVYVEFLSSEPFKCI